MGIIDTLKNKWVYGSMLVRLIYINVAFFALLHIATLVLTFTDIKPEYALTWIELPSSPDLFITQPWTIITYMFAQYDLLHILFNMLWLYWFGTIFLLTDTSKRMLALYIYGGICGGALFMAVYNLVPAYNYTLAWLIGSSASVIAIVTATAVMHPDYKVGLLFFGPVALKWIAIITIAIDFFSITGDNGGGHIAHIGGALTGVIYAVALKHGTDITKPFNRLAEWWVNLVKRITSPRPAKQSNDYTRYRYQSDNSSKAKAEKPKSGKTAESATTNRDDEATLDEILDKIKKSGYSALTHEEKQRLFDVSRRIK